MGKLYDIFWDIKANKALDEIYDYYLNNFSKLTASKVRREIIESIEFLIEQPERYPPEPMLENLPGNLRYINVRHFRIIYEFNGREVIIVYIFNAKKNPDRLLEEIEE